MGCLPPAPGWQAAMWLGFCTQFGGGYCKVCRYILQNLRRGGGRVRAPHAEVGGPNTGKQSGAL